MIVERYYTSADIFRFALSVYEQTMCDVRRCASIISFSSEPKKTIFKRTIKFFNLAFEKNHLSLSGTPTETKQRILATTKIINSSHINRLYLRITQTFDLIIDETNDCFDVDKARMFIVYRNDCIYKHINLVNFKVNNSQEIDLFIIYNFLKHFGR